jgi:hypothetical protein
MTFAIRQPHTPNGGRDTIVILVDGIKVQTVRLASDDWHEVTVPLCKVSFGEVFVFEMQLGSLPGSLDHGLFEVRDRNFN